MFYENTKRVESLSKIGFTEILSLSTKNQTLNLMESSIRVSIEWLLAHRYVQHGLLILLYTLKKIVYRIAPLTLTLINTDCMLLL